jgi:hypothetical protein
MHCAPWAILGSEWVLAAPLSLRIDEVLLRCVAAKAYDLATDQIREAASKLWAITQRLELRRYELLNLIATLRSWMLRDETSPTNKTFEILLSFLIVLMPLPKGPREENEAHHNKRYEWQRHREEKGAVDLRLKKAFDR